MHDTDLKRKAAAIEGAVATIQRWRVYLALVGVGAAAFAIKIIGRAPKTEPPATAEHVGWLLFFAGLCATIPLAVGVFRMFNSVRKDVGI